MLSILPREEGQTIRDGYTRKMKKLLILFGIFVSLAVTPPCRSFDNETPEGIGRHPTESSEPAEASYFLWGKRYYTISRVRDTASFSLPYEPILLVINENPLALHTSSGEPWQVGLREPDISAQILALSDVEYPERNPLAFLSEDEPPLVLTVRPSVTYQVSNWIIPGGELAAFDFLADTPMFTSRDIDSFPKEQLFTDSRNAPGVLGVLLNPQSGTRLAITYREKGNLPIDRAADLVGRTSTVLAALGPTGIKEDTLSPDDLFPQSLLLTGVNRFTRRLTVLGSFGWLDWSDFEQSDPVLGSMGSRSDGENSLRDSWHIGIGARYHIADPWVVSAGVGVDTFSPDREDGDFVTGSSDLARYATAIRYSSAPRLSVGAGYLFIRGVDPSPDGLSATLWGAEDTVHLFNIDLDWRF